LLEVSDTKVVVTIFEYSDYKRYVEKRIHAMPGRGRGEFRKIADHLRMHPTMVSQVFKGDKDLTREQALDLCVYFGLGELETEYFLALVDFERAGSEKLKSRVRKQLTVIKTQSLKLANRLPSETRLSEEARAIFYSNWQYSGIRLLTSIEGYNNVDEIAAYFRISKARAGKIVEFLVQTGLCISADGKLKMGPRQTHLEADSPLVQRHHSNWRLKAMQRYENLTDEELCYTGPMSISAEDFSKIREMLVQLVQGTTKIATTSKEEGLACLNIDWFRY
jgi:uncharacterized protein (TIGR02147 family)